MIRKCTDINNERNCIGFNYESQWLLKREQHLLFRHCICPFHEVSHVRVAVFHVCVCVCVYFTLRERQVPPLFRVYVSPGGGGRHPSSEGIHGIQGKYCV